METAAARRGRGSILLPVAKRGSQVEVLVLETDQSSLFAELLADLVEKAGLGWYQVQAILPLVGILIAEGAELLVTGCVAAGLQHEWGLTSGQKGSLSSLAFLGLACGTWLSGAIADTLGRRAAILTSYAGMAVLGAASAQAAGFLSMAICRILNGVFCGIGLPATFVLLSELFPQRYRSTSYAIIGISKGLGEVYVGFLMLHWMPDMKHGSWRSVTAWAAMPAALFFAVSLWLTRESPYWLSVQGRLEEARDVLLEMARMNGNLDKMQRLAETCRCPEELPAKKLSDSKLQPEQRFWDVLRLFVSSRQSVLKLIVCTGLCAIGNLLTFGMAYFWPQLLQSEPAGLSPLGSPSMMLIAIRAFAALDCLGCIALMGSPLGLRWIVAISAFATALSLSWCWIGLAAPDAHLLLAGGLSCASAGVFYSGALSMTSESFPTEVRGFVAGSCITFGRVGSIVAPWLIEALGLRAFLALAGLLAWFAGAVGLLIPETKGQPLEDFCNGAPAAGADPLAETAPVLKPWEKDFGSRSSYGSSSDSDSASRRENFRPTTAALPKAVASCRVPSRTGAAAAETVV